MSEQRLNKLREREKQLKAQIQNIENRINSNKRKEDTRRKILLGAVILNALQNNKIDNGLVKNLLNNDLVKTKDRQLFGLPEEKYHG